MFSLLALCFFLIYFWYFYHFSSKPVPRPSSTTAPENPPRFEMIFVAVKHHLFRFFDRGYLYWEHIFKDDAYLVQAHSEKIIQRDACYHYPKRTLIAATGLALYQYLKQHPEFQKDLAFQEDSDYTAQHGDVFYFTCFQRRIEALDMCPSGHIFQNQVCVPISSCTGKADFTHLPVHADPTKYIECKNGREFMKSCPPDTLFYHDQCIPPDDFALKCRLSNTVVPYKLDKTTLFECRDYQPVYTTCSPGTQMIDSLVCEPDLCVGRPDHAKLGLPMRTLGPFRFAPGYYECLNGKLWQTVECPTTWDPMLTQGDNLTHLPMVFDGQRCAVPSFGVNVTSDDPDVLVPIHEFTKDVQNWKQAPYYDQTVGYQQTPTGRKRKQVDPGQRIGKHFKVESACDVTSPIFLPIYGRPAEYYNCVDQQVVPCPAQHYFTGSACQKEPPHAFKYKGVPLFHFDHLNDEGWIRPWEYLDKKQYMKGCHSNEDVYLRLYNICSHPDCVPYAFLFMVPHLTLFLPVREQAACTYDPVDRHIKKKTVTLNYTFWEQKILPAEVKQPDTCTVGQTLKTGHFVWDTTIYATCDVQHPFVFCPSPHTRQLVWSERQYACSPPAGNTIRHTNTKEWTQYTDNEVKRILPPVWDQSPYLFQPNRRHKQHLPLPETGYDLPPGRLNLRVNRPVDLELRYRVTHPPNVAFQYDDQNLRHALNPVPPDTLAKPKGFLMKMEKFVESALTFPTYTPQELVNHFDSDYHP